MIGCSAFADWIAPNIYVCDQRKPIQVQVEKILYALQR